jgi:hypothetical protein
VAENLLNILNVDTILEQLCSASSTELVQPEAIGIQAGTFCHHLADIQKVRLWPTAATRKNQIVVYPLNRPLAKAPPLSAAMCHHTACF